MVANEAVTPKPPLVALAAASNAEGAVVAAPDDSASSAAAGLAVGAGVASAADVPTPIEVEGAGEAIGASSHVVKPVQPFVSSTMHAARAMKLSFVASHTVSLITVHRSANNSSQSAEEVSPRPNDDAESDPKVSMHTLQTSSAAQITASVGQLNPLDIAKPTWARLMPDHRPSSVVAHPQPRAQPMPQLLLLLRLVCMRLLL